MQSQVFADSKNSIKSGKVMPNSSPLLLTDRAKNQSKIPKRVRATKKKQIISKKYSIVLIDWFRN